MANGTWLWNQSTGETQYMGGRRPTKRTYCHPMQWSAELLRFHNSCQLCLCLCLSCNYLSTNSVPRHMTVGYPVIFIPLFTWTFPPRFSELLSSLTLCHYYSVIISGYQLGLFTLHFNPRLSVSGYGHARNNLYYLSHAYSMSQKFLVVIFRVLICLSQFWISTQLLQLVPRT